ncbi:LLM class flavin-dependent oxidoreductase [Pseudonocardia thermophila]|uniref:LLM class flavin-dependent oxidoreductase n=1 Tax=Pseudonocardia thermophila TaxID=1848 RepID=UPI000936D6E2|nr:LLM class flavin-dependent oxidoreductase [Pseudonocardia thermophila]
MIVPPLRRPMHLAAFVEGVNHTTAWRDPRAGDQMAFSSFAHIARTVERGRFDFLFLGQGLRMRERNGQLFELDIAGRPESFTMMSALSDVTTHLGLAVTINTTFTDPVDIARSFATLDHLSGGRAAWNVVTSSDAFTGENFRRGGYLDYRDRYRRASDVVDACRALWAGGPVDRADGLAPVRGVLSVPPPPQGQPVIIQAGDSAEGVAFGARVADIIFSRHSALPDAISFRADVDRAARAAGREPGDLRVLPIARIVLGDTAEEAAERAREIGFAQVGPQRALAFAEQVWGRDLSGFDPDGPLPDFDPVRPETPLLQGRVQSKADPAAVVARWRERAAEEGHTLRSLMVAEYAAPTFVGTPAEVADAMIDRVATGACDGYVLGTHLMPGGFDEIVDRVVPLLQERGALRTDYTGATLREHLGLQACPGSRAAV